MKIIVTTKLSTNERNGLQSLFDKEYLKDYGPWTFDNPYGYSSLENHVLALDGECIIGYAGSQTRIITVGNKDITIAGVGGVLVDEKYCSSGIASNIMKVLIDYKKNIMNDVENVDYLKKEEIYIHNDVKRWKEVSQTQNRIMDFDMQNIED